MKLYNQLKLRFDTPIWCLHPELGLLDILLDKNPHFVTLVSDDETATRLLKRIKKNKKDDNDRLDEQRNAAKKLNYEINNSKNENLPGLFDPYLSTLKSLILESFTAVRNSSIHIKATPELKAFIPLMIKVYRNAYKHVLHMT